MFSNTENSKAFLYLFGPAKNEKQSYFTSSVFFPSFVLLILLLDFHFYEKEFMECLWQRRRQTESSYFLFAKAVLIVHH